MTLDQIISWVELIADSFSRAFEILSFRVSEFIDGIVTYFGKDSIIGKIIEVLFSDIAPNVTLIEVLFGVGLLTLVIWILFKFVIDSIPLVGS